MNYLHFSRRALLGILALQSVMMYSCTKDIDQKKEETLGSLSAKSSATTSISTIIHPGILNSKTNLDLIRSQANVTGSARYNDYNATVVQYMTDHPLPTSFPTSVIVEASGSTPTETQFKTDAILAYAAALRWAKTGSSTYSTQAKNILNGWATNFRTLVPASGTSTSQTYLEASWAAPSFAAAAEILRRYQPGGTSSGWTSTEITQFETFLNLLKNSYVNKALTTGNNNNWKVSAGYAKMAIGVFTSSVTEYQSGVDALINVFPYVIQSNGTMPEHCERNDCWHFQYSLTGLTYAAEIGRMQGDNSIYTYSSNRLALGFAYLKDALDDITHCQSCTPTSGIWPGVEVAYKYYKNSTLQNLRERKPPYSVSDNLFLGFTTYTHFNTN